MSSKWRDRWVLCIRNRGCRGSLEIGKVYRAIPDIRGAAHRFVRVIDEPGEDYLYPEKYFLALELNEPVKKALLRASQQHFAGTA
jgi:hypothetical protein